MKNQPNIFPQLLSVALIVLRLCDVILWPWVWVLCPIWGPYALIFFIALWHAIRKEERRKHAKEKQSV